MILVCYVVLRRRRWITWWFFAPLLWYKLLQGFGVQHVQGSSFNSWIIAWRGRKWGSVRAKWIWSKKPAAVIWVLWRERNARVFKDSQWQGGGMGGIVNTSHFGALAGPVAFRFDFLTNFFCLLYICKCFSVCFLIQVLSLPIFLDNLCENWRL